MLREMDAQCHERVPYGKGVWILCGSNVWFNPYRLNMGFAHFTVEQRKPSEADALVRAFPRCIYWERYGEQWEDGAMVASMSEPTILGQEGYIDPSQER